MIPKSHGYWDRNWGGYNKNPYWDQEEDSASAGHRDRTPQFGQIHKKTTLRCSRDYNLSIENQLTEYVAGVDFNGTNWNGMATRLRDAASELMDKLSTTGYRSDKKSPLIDPRFTPPTGFTNVQLASIADIAREPDEDSFYYEEKDKNNPTWMELFTMIFWYSHCLFGRCRVHIRRFSIRASQRIHVSVFECFSEHNRLKATVTQCAAIAQTPYIQAKELSDNHSMAYS